jgi:hypothetical protein
MVRPQPAARSEDADPMPAAPSPHSPAELPGADGLRRAGGRRYRAFLADLHARMVFDWYLEIGCRKGESFAPVRSRTIAVDPFFRIDTNVIGSKPALLIFQTTSDAFFESGFLKPQGIRLSFSFLDGMHLFEYLLRDFINTEAHSDPAGVIAMHDCVPFSVAMTTRDLDNLPKGAWTGDVWKLIPILRQYRPDLKVTVLDCPPSGLVLVSGLDPENRVLSENMDRILGEYAPGIEEYGVQRFADGFDFTSAAGYAAAGFPDFAAIARNPTEVAQPVKVTP